MPRRLNVCANLFELQALEVRRFLTAASLNSSTHTLTITGTSSAESIVLNQSASTGKVSITGVTTTFTPGSSTNQFNKIVIDAGGGNDTIQINGNVAYTNATLGGGGGNDTMISGSGADVISGGSGFDTANYSLRTTGINVTIDNVANDGQINEKDNVTTDTEEVLGGSGNDSFTGSSGDNFFAGGAGNDTAKGMDGNDDLIGSTGQDSLEGNNGDDFLQAKNSDVDTVKGGTNSDGTADFDLAEVDGVDVAAATFAAPRALAVQAASPPDRAQLDPTYNDTGLNTGPDFNWRQISASAIDSQGRVILVGYDSRANGEGYDSEDMVAVRYNANGTFDDTFGSSGEAVLDLTTTFGTGYADDDRAYGVTTDANDNIYIVGSHTQYNFGGDTSDFALVKLNSAGQRDSLFGSNGQAIEDFNANPSVGGGYNDEAHDALVDANGNIVVVGWQNNNFGSDVVVMRFTSAGVLDPTFGPGGQTFVDVDPGNNTYDTAVAVALWNTGSGNDPHIVVGGSSNGDFLVARFDNNGVLDGSFGGGYGYHTDAIVDAQDDAINDIAVDNNTLFVVGQTSQIVIFRGTFGFNPNTGTSAVVAKYDVSGNLTGSSVSTDDASIYTSVVVDPLNANNLILAGANATNFIWGQVEESTLANNPNFNGGQWVQTDFTPVNSSEYYDLALEVGVTSDGKVILGGYSDTCDDGCIQTSVARYGLDASGGPVDVTEGIEQFISYDKLQARPPQEPLASRLRNLSISAKLYVLAQPDDQGRATFDLSNANDCVTITKGFDENGNAQIFVNVNNVVIPYDLGSTTLFRFNLLGGNDCLFTNQSITIPIIVYAGDGNDIVTTGAGNDLINGGKGIDVLYGGAGNDVILGGADSDAIGGDGGNDLLIGGTGADALFGGSGEDILIGGTTSHDSNEAALLAIIDEWGSANSNADRIAHLRGTLPGGANGSYFLKVGSGATVFNDTSSDALTGLAGRDWFFRKLANPNKDQILDNIAGEEVTNM